MRCVFCDILAGRVPGRVLAEADRVVAILSLGGHPLVLTCRCVPRLAHLDDAEAGEMMQLATRLAKALHGAMGCEGVSCVLSDGSDAGQDVPHVHLHVKPRWTGDGTALRWDTAALPEPERARRAEAVRRALGPAG